MQKPSSTIQRYFGLFDTLVMHVTSDGQVFDFDGHCVPAWFSSRVHSIGHQVDRDWLTDIFPFLDCFWEIADNFWKSGEKSLVRSGVWEEEVEEQGSVHLEAIASRLGNTQLLFVGPLMFDYIAKSKLLQQGRELLLAHEALAIREQELRLSRTQQRDLLWAIPDTYLMIDDRNRIIEHNSQDLPRGKEGCPLGCYFGEEHLTHVRVGLEVVRDTKQNREMDLRKNAGGTRNDLELRMVYLEQTRVLVVIRDVTRQRETERLKDDFLSQASHELKAPLTGISGCMGYLLDDFKELPQEIVKWLTMSRESSDHLLRMVNNLLRVQKIESGYQRFSKAYMDMGKFLTNAGLSFVGLSKGTGIDIKVMEPELGLRVWADPDAIRQVLDNLVSNAVKHSPHDRPVEVAVRRHGDKARITVQDYGPGIPENYQEKVFEKFIQAPGDRARKKGTGLGLTIAKAIVAEHKGRIGVESEPGSHTVFFVDLPLADPDLYMM